MARDDGYELLDSGAVGHLGIFPEQRAQWAWLRKELAVAPP